MKGKRIYLFDNLKGVLTVLVVIGHFLLPVEDANSLNAAIFQLIYFFHMPFFVFISGLFAKGVYRDGRLRIERILSLFLLALIYQFLLLLIERGDMKGLLEFSSAPWYLVSLCTWYLMVPALSQVRPSFAVAGAFAISIVSGFFTGGGHFLSIERTVVFLPWFVLGYFMSPKRLASFVSTITGLQKVLIVCAFALMGAFALMLCDQLDCFYLVYGTGLYSSNVLLGAIERVCLFVTAFIMSFSVMAVCPDKKVKWLSTIGERSLQVFVIHRLVRGLLERFLKIYDLPIINSMYGGIAVLTIISLIVVVFSSSNLFDSLFKRLVNLKWKILIRE